MKLCTQFWPIDGEKVDLHCCTSKSCVISCTAVILGWKPHLSIDIIHFNGLSSLVHVTRQSLTIELNFGGIHMICTCKIFRIHYMPSQWFKYIQTSPEGSLDILDKAYYLCLALIVIVVLPYQIYCQRAWHIMILWLLTCEGH